MKTRRIEDRKVRAGIVGVVLAASVVLATLQYRQLPFFAADVSYTAEFADAGGLSVGDDVDVAGIKVGRVQSIELSGDHVRVRFALPPRIRLGERTTAMIKTLTVLGRKLLAVQPAGTGRLAAHSDIPIQRTTSPYSLTDALGDLTDTVDTLDTTQLNDALNTLSDALSDTPAPLRATMGGVAALSRSLNARDQALRDLLAKAQQVTGVLATRSGQVNTLVDDGDQLLAELDLRRTAISELIANVGAVSQQLTGLVQDNRTQLTPALTQVNQVLALLQRNRDKINQAVDGLEGYAVALSEQVGSGPYFQALVQGAFGPDFQMLLDAMLRPDHLPTDLHWYLTHPVPSIQPAPGGK
jgi:phospholipid/cholesterol/gamma-HCH transport system substrate-binding protein